MVRGEKRALWVPVHVLEQNWFHLHCSEWNSSECSNKHQSRSPPHLPCSSLVRTLAGTHSSPQQIFEWQTLWPKHQQETTVSVSGARYDFFADTELLEASFSSQLQYCWCGYTQIFRLPRPTSRPTEAVPSQLTPNLVPSLLGSVALISLMQCSKSWISLPHHGSCLHTHLQPPPETKVMLLHLTVTRQYNM